MMFSTATSRSLVESDDDLLDGELRKSISSSIYAALCQGDSCKGGHIQKEISVVHLDVEDQVRGIAGASSLMP